MSKFPDLLGVKPYVSTYQSRSFVRFRQCEMQVICSCRHLQRGVFLQLEPQSVGTDEKRVGEPLAAL